MVDDDTCKGAASWDLNWQFTNIVERSKLEDEDYQCVDTTILAAIIDHTMELAQDSPLTVVHTKYSDLF